MFYCILQLHYADIAIFTDIAFLLVEITRLSSAGINRFGFAQE
jgi:hypothetical protein